MTYFAQLTPDGYVVHVATFSGMPPYEGWVAVSNWPEAAAGASSGYRYHLERGAWEPSPNIDFELALAVKAERAVRLTASDWTQLPDVPLETKAQWATYRQALRDITTQSGYPSNVVWPIQPQ